MPTIPHPWQARWIWAAGAAESNARVLFRCVCDLDDPANTELLICADRHYRVWIDGVLLGDGPLPSHPARQYFDRRALPAELPPGRHGVSVLVHHLDGANGHRGGLLAELRHRDGRVLAASGSAWQCQVPTAWATNTERVRSNHLHPYQEHVDLRQLPPRWHEAEAATGAWQTPVVLTSRGRERPGTVAPWLRLVERDIAWPEQHLALPVAVSAEECLDLACRHRPQDVSVSLAQTGRPVAWSTVQSPEALCRGDGGTVLQCSTRHHDLDVDGRYDPALLLDFGRVLTGHVELVIDAAPDGAVFEMGYAERLVDGRFNNALECPFADRCTVAAGATVFRPLAWRCFRYVRLRLKQAEAPVALRALRVRELRYPLGDRGAFASQHGRLERIAAISRATLRLCSLESLMDTPQREQAQWLGDVAAITVPGVIACFGDTALAAKFLRQATVNAMASGLLANLSNVAIAEADSTIPDYSLWWVRCVEQVHRYTGDDALLDEVYPEVLRVLAAHAVCADAEGLLVDVPGWVFIDWADLERHGACAAHNALYAAACDAGAYLAESRGDQRQAQRYAAQAAAVRAAFAMRFLDPERGVIIDAVIDGVRSARISEHANAAAIACGCVDAATADTIIERIFAARSLPATEAQPFFMTVVLDALRQRGHMALALDLMERRWGRMLDRGQTTCSEEWYHNGSWRSGAWQGFMRTLSHAWSACPAEFLIQHLAGISVLEPGCRRVRVAPYRAPFAYTARYPLPQGDLAVAWDGTQARICAPAGVVVESVGGETVAGR